MRGCPACPHFIDYGRTFRVPVWSWPDATYPAISRWFINTFDGNVSTRGRWRYSHDLVHFSEAGAGFFVQNIAGPFLKEQILTPRPRASSGDEAPASKWNDVFEFDLHVTPRAPLKLSLATYTSWGLHENTLVNITYPPAQWLHNHDHQSEHHRSHNDHPRNGSYDRDRGWVFEQALHRRHSPDNIHTCYASSSNFTSSFAQQQQQQQADKKIHNSSLPAEFFFSTPPTTEQDKFASCSGSISGYCALSVSSLRSWNRSYVGNMTCSLFMEEEKMSPRSSSFVHLADVFIHGNLNDQGVPMKHTSPVSALVYTNITDNERYILRCRKLDDLYACIDSVEISAEVDVR